MKTLKLPLMFDPDKNKPSVTLMFPYFSFIVLIICIICLAKQNLVQGTLAAGSVWFLSTVFYLLRRLNKLNLDIDDRKLELEGGDNEQKSNSN